MVEPQSLNFRVITTNILGVRTFRKFKVGGFVAVFLSKMVATVVGSNSFHAHLNLVHNFPIPA